MARRTIAVGLAEDVELYGQPLWHDIPQRGYVGSRWSTEMDGPFHALLWSEIRHIEEVSRMTARQASIFEWHIIGVKSVKIAEVLKISEATVSEHLNAALSKAATVKNVGLVTCVLEECGGWAALGELLNS